MSRVYVVGTGDTKGAELRYVAEQVSAAADGLDVVIVDVGTTADGALGGIPPREIAAAHPDGAQAVFGEDRGESVGAMSLALECYVRKYADDVAGIIGIGGSGGTSLITPAMRALPIGVPKLMVSTVASSDVSAYVGPSDIAMLYSVADVAGLNRITRTVLGNAAHAMAGMVEHPVVASGEDRPAVGVTMFGVTTPAVTQIVERLGEAREALVFHATGTGGASMEKLAESGLLQGIIDLTTTEIADLLVGGVFPAADDRLDVIARTRIPYVGSVGALDMANFGAKATVPAEFADRLLHVHNANVTLMRTTPAENTVFGEWIGAKLNACDGPVRFLLPERGVSMLDAEGAPFHDVEADEALFTALEATVQPTADRRIERIPLHINDPEFADAVVSAYDDITG